MNDLLDRQFEDAIRGALTDDARRAPHAPRWWGPIAAMTPPPRVRWVAVAASVLVIAVVGAVAALATRTDDTPTINGTPSTTTFREPAIVDQWVPSPAPTITARSGFVSVSTGTGWFVWGGWSREGDTDPEASMDDGAYFDGSTGEWKTLPDAPIANEFQAAYGLWTGSEVIVVVAGSEPLITAFDPATFRWRAIPVPDEMRSEWPRTDGRYARGWHRFIAGKLVMYFPTSSDGGPALLVFDPSNGQWTTGAAPPTTNDDLVLGLAASSDELFVLGAGQRNSDSACLGSTPLHTYDLATDTWASRDIPHGNWQPAVVAWTGDSLLLAGGRDCGSEEAVRTSAILDPELQTWTDVADVTDDLPYVITEPVVTGPRVVAVGESGRPASYSVELRAWWSGPALWPDRTIGDLSIAVIGDRLVTWSASPWESEDGVWSCCQPNPAAFALQLPDASRVTGPPATVSTATTVTLVESGICIDGSYILQEGDTPHDLAVKFDLSVEALAFANVGTPGYDAFIVGTRVLIPTAGPGCQMAPNGDGAAIVVTMPPDSTDAQIALVRAVLDDLGAPIDATRTEFRAGGDAAVFFVFADPAADPTTLYSIAEELRHLPGVAGVTRPMN